MRSGSRSPGRCSTDSREQPTPGEALPLVLNAAERRGALVVLLLLLIGTGHDLWRASRPPARLAVPPAPVRPDPPAARDTATVRSRESDARADHALDLNRAGVAELDGLPGIGPVLARRIVEHRRRNGPFRRVEELRAVRGVGPRLLERLRSRVRVSGPTP